MVLFTESLMRIDDDDDDDDDDVTCNKMLDEFRLMSCLMNRNTHRFSMNFCGCHVDRIVCRFHSGGLDAKMAQTQLTNLVDTGHVSGDQTIAAMHGQP